MFILENCGVALLTASDFYFKDSELFFRLAFVDFDSESVMNAFEKHKIIDANFIKTYCPLGVVSELGSDSVSIVT